LRGDVGQFLRSLWFIAMSGDTSFMSIIIQLYLLHPFLRRWTRTRGRPEAILIAAFAVQILWSTWAELLTVGTNEWQRCFPSFIGYFVAGYYLLAHSEEAVRLARRPAAARAGGALWLAVAIALAVFVDLPMLRDLSDARRIAGTLAMEFLVPVMCFAALALVLPLVRREGFHETWAGRLLQSLGLYSFGVYLLHFFFLLVLGTAMRKGLGLGVDDALYYVLLLALTTFGTLLTLRALARLPFGRYLT
jgi:peptidoglycan/LPS O-acetylase OafA/YrhL